MKDVNSRMETMSFNNVFACAKMKRVLSILGKKCLWQFVELLRNLKGCSQVFMNQSSVPEKKGGKLKFETGYFFLEESKKYSGKKI